MSWIPCTPVSEPNPNPIPDLYSYYGTHRDMLKLLCLSNVFKSFCEF